MSLSISLMTNQKENVDYSIIILQLLVCPTILTCTHKKMLIVVYSNGRIITPSAQDVDIGIQSKFENGKSVYFNSNLNLT